MNTRMTSFQTRGPDCMLAEYALLRELRRDVISHGESRVNFYMTVVSGALIGLALINQLSGYREVMFYLDTIVVLGLLMLGWVTFVRMVERSMSVIVYTRGLNRIRRYFVDENPGLEQYFILPISDEYPSFTAVGNLPKAVHYDVPTTVAIVNSVVIAIGISLLMSVVFTLPMVLDVLASILAFVVLLVFQLRYSLKRSREMEKSFQVQFATHALLSNNQMDN